MGGSIQTITIGFVTLNKKKPPHEKKSVPCLVGAVLALFVFGAFPSSAQATDPVFFHTKYGTGTNLSVQMTSSTPGAIIFFTMGSNGQGYLDDPTHNGSTPINPTVLYYGPVSVPYSQVRYFAALAWTPSGGDSEVTYWEQPNPYF